MVSEISLFDSGAFVSLLNKVKTAERFRLQICLTFSHHCLELLDFTLSHCKIFLSLF